MGLWTEIRANEAPCATGPEASTAGAAVFRVVDLASRLRDARVQAGLAKWLGTALLVLGAIGGVTTGMLGRDKTP
jgi:hypothetical protein